MKNFQSRDDNRGGGFRGGDRGGKPSFPKKSWGNDRGGDRGDRGGDRAEVTMHKATCSDCKKMCEVPFRPSGDKPVFCRDCFDAKRDSNDERGGNGRDFDNRAPKRSWSDRTPKPDFARPSFTPSPAPHAGVDEAMKRQLSDISFKLDKLVMTLEKMSERKHEVKVEAPKVEVPTFVIKEVKEKAETEVKSAKKVAVKKVAVKKVAEKKTVAKKVAAKKTK